ncbi:MAG TPA: AmmeMemoRadiSam system protein A [Anaerolineae bacterium]|nr:AmmeMemoRadiSam system protein A [Anaerolineae bacterium]
MPKTHPLVELARRTIVTYVRTGKTIEPPAELTPEMRQRAGAFVSLHRGGELRGCIGTITPAEDNLAEEVIQNAISAATRDPRFPPVAPSELEELDVKVDVLGEPEPIAGPEELDPRRYGLIVQSTAYPWRRGLLLPDLQGIDTVEQQVYWTRVHKAGIRDPDEPVEMFRFEVRRYT